MVCPIGLNKILPEHTGVLTAFRWPAAFGSAALNMGMPDQNTKTFSSEGGTSDIALAVLTGLPAQIEHDDYTEDGVCR